MTLSESITTRPNKQRGLKQSMQAECKAISGTMESRDQAVKAQFNEVGAMTGLWSNMWGGSTLIPSQSQARSVC
ncbi:hypothetical protein FZI91_20330 [Mycobacterium sp. CBMA271]|uniref:hypothetical protein n=1 Tax=unclassified Mycobacteroides TaxID=2618759 RepID=UPI0012DF665E|nr:MULTISPECIES: hypothetical protein [unclassified Mycobacteroides]MUM16977.1 hypothetical protein [Mycobacteroides sp. CBMA 326]MUM24035.1 hypothetical protein [Mycobacteroides sp. CBMA 271]